MPSNDAKVNEKKYKYEILWFMVSMGTLISIESILGIYYISVGKVLTKTLFFSLATFLIGGIGAGPGAHRFFSHHAYKATRQFKIFLIFAQQISGMKSVISWCQIHRVHHKFSDTEADPTNIKRGLFFSFFGWLFIAPTPQYIYESNRIDLDDLFSDSDVAFQYKHYSKLYIAITMLLPTIIPTLIWNESIYVAFSMNMLKMSLNFLQLLVGNGFVHWDGPKPYDATSTATDNVLYNFITLGEGFHNYHHTFPFDYRNNEFSSLWYVNSLSTFFIDLCGLFGLVYDKKIATPEMIRRRVLKTGDGSHWIAKRKALKTNENDYSDENVVRSVNGSLKLESIAEVMKDVKILQEKLVCS
ncbi:unnamed protein product [Chironomus riparius]|uniref:Fatty acid desaturase domain-containing protein n=1 Tax=Chironomus riparius TaxID=315576 RepID=A0A9N9S029_9DIPT|nr:unnamed protein product [Chironomus riparius]